MLYITIFYKIIYYNLEKKLLVNFIKIMILYY